MTIRLRETPIKDFKPKEIEASIGFLMRRYLRLRSAFLAVAVSQHIEALLTHPDYKASTEQRCVYRRMIRHWKVIAACDTDWPR